MVCGFLTVVASLVVERRLQARGLQQLWHVGSVVVAHGLQSTGSVVVAHSLSVSMGSPWIREQTRVPYIGSGFLTTAPPERSLLQNIEQHSLCYTVGLCWLSILNIAVCTCQSQTPSLSLPLHPSPVVTIISFSKSLSLFLFCK